VLDHASMPEKTDPAPDARSGQKMSVLSGNRTASQQKSLIPKTR